MKRLFKDIYTRFALVTGVVVLLVILITQSHLARQERQALATRLSEKAAFINSFYSFLIGDALTRNDDVTLLQVINRLEEDQEIVSVVVVDQRNEVRYHVDPQKIGAPWEDELVTKALQQGDGVVTAIKVAGNDGLALVSPLKVKGKPKPIGAVRIEMTYNHIDKQVKASMSAFPLIVLGAVGTCVGLMLYWVQRWILKPMIRLERSIRNLNPALLEANLPEGDDDFGRIHVAINDFIVRLKAEWQNQQLNQMNQADQERMLAAHMAELLSNGQRVLLANRDNRIIGDVGASDGVAVEPGQHLLDLITDGNFGSLLASAFQKEGEKVQGGVVFQDQRYEAAVLRIPEAQSALIKTLILLRKS